MNQNNNVTERLASIDTIRGVALMGLLTMNLVGMSMPLGAYLSPEAFRTNDALNLPIFSIFFVFADQKFMGMFSLLFGASMLLLIDRLKAKGKPSLGVHYRRNSVLLLIGLAHALYLWEGDVLFIYGVCALLLYPLHRSSPWVLAFIAALLIAAASQTAGSFADKIPSYSVEEIALAEDFLRPSVSTVAQIKQNYSGSYQEIFNARLGLDKESSEPIAQIELLILLSTFYRALGMMCLGMALFKIGYLQGDFASTVYKQAMTIGFAVGLPLAIFAWFLGQQSSWAVAVYFGPWGIMPISILSSVALVIAYVSGIVLVCRSQWAPKLQTKIQALGKTALSNYLLQSLLGTSVMYGYGLGMWGEVARWQLCLLMFVIWGLQLFWSSWWLTYFRQGPVEYLWRCVTYFSLPAFKR